MESEVHETAYASRLHLRHACDRIGIEHAISDDAQTSRALCNKDAAIRKKGHAPGLSEPFGDGETELAFDTGIHNDGAIRQRWGGPHDWGRRCGRSRRGALLHGGLLGETSHSGEDKRRNHHKVTDPRTPFHRCSPSRAIRLRRNWPSKHSTVRHAA